MGDKGKVAAAKLVAEEFKDAILNANVIGIGTGSTISQIINVFINEGLLEGKTIVPSSIDTTMKLSSKGVRIIHPSSVTMIDIYFDGADEIDPFGNMVKGRGAALYGEKMLAYKSKVNVFVVDESKLVTKLGSSKPVPLEVNCWMLGTVELLLSRMGYCYEYRKGGKDGPVISDFGGVIIDVYTGPMEDPYDVEEKLLYIPGIVETGLFLGYTDYVVVGWDKGGGEVRRYSRSRGVNYN
ncbi:MAG: ribose 5-phosphate isomerase A [Desulfurococcales archaeon]|nr:ribose 5-phosphate isomerase A [Desulfurococcales archaeon]